MNILTGRDYSSHNTWGLDHCGFIYHGYHGDLHAFYGNLHTAGCSVP